MTRCETTTSNDVAEHYDDLDEYYRELWGEHLHHGLWKTGRESVETAVQNLIELVAEKAEVRNSEVCDVGCGYGGTSRTLAREFDARVTGVTISQKQWEYAQERNDGSGNPRILLQNWLENDFPDESFDRVIAIECYTHMPDQNLFLQQANRVLREDGKLVMCVWMTGDNPTIEQQKKLLQPICDEGRLTNMPTESELRAMLEENGFNVVEFSDLSEQVRKTWMICIRRAVGRVITRPRYWKFLLDKKQKNRVFLKTLFRLDKAYKSGCMRYGLVIAEKT